MATVFNMKDPYAGAAASMQGLLGSLGQAIQRKQLIDSLPQDDPRRNLIRGLPVHIAQTKVASAMRDPLEEQAAQENIQLTKARAINQIQTAVRERQTKQFAIEEEQRKVQGEQRKVWEEQRKRKDQEIQEAGEYRSIMSAWRNGDLTDEQATLQIDALGTSGKYKKPGDVRNVLTEKLAKKPGKYLTYLQDYLDMGIPMAEAKKWSSDAVLIENGQMTRVKSPAKAIDEFERWSRVYRNVLENVDFRNLKTGDDGNFIYPPKVQRVIDMAQRGMGYYADMAGMDVQTEIDRIKKTKLPTKATAPSNDPMNLR